MRSLSSKIILSAQNKYTACRQSEHSFHIHLSYHFHTHKKDVSEAPLQKKIQTEIVSTVSYLFNLCPPRWAVMCSSHQASNGYPTHQLIWLLTPSASSLIPLQNQPHNQKPWYPLLHPSQTVCWSQKGPCPPPQSLQITLINPLASLFITLPLFICTFQPKSAAFITPSSFFLTSFSFSFLLHCSLTVVSFNRGLYWEWLYAWLTRSWTPLHQWRTLPARFQCIQLTCTPYLHI